MSRWIDVSYAQGAIDWSAVAAAGIVGAVVRASHGARVDVWARRNLEGAAAAGLDLAAYHYLESSATATEQASALLDAVGEAPLRFVALDVESPYLSPQRAAELIPPWLAAVEGERGGAPCWVYTGLEPAARLRLAEIPGLGERPLWVAHWRARAPIVPAPWSAWRAWQWSSEGSVPGIHGRVDLDEVAP